MIKYSEIVEGQKVIVNNHSNLGEGFINFVSKNKEVYSVEYPSGQILHMHKKIRKYLTKVNTK